MGIVNLKNLPSLHLNDLLRRKKKTLAQFLREFGISTYEGLKARCERIGVVSPSLEKFEEACPKPVSSPTEGIIVLEALVDSNEHVEPENDHPEIIKKPKRKKTVEKVDAFSEHVSTDILAEDA